MTQRGLAEVLDDLETIVEEFGVSTRNPTCLYSTEEGVPVCLIGTLLNEYGIEVPLGLQASRPYSLRHQLSEVEGAVTFEAAAFLTTVQEFADGSPPDGADLADFNCTWGHSLDLAKAYWSIAPE